MLNQNKITFFRDFYAFRLYYLCKGKTIAPLNMKQRNYFSLLIILLAFIFNTNGFSASVAVHDPSVIVVYKDASGNSFPENNASGTRTKYYYIFGTMIGGAYSTDMINWTSFTPSFSLNGNISRDYYQLFKSEADYAGHTTTQTVQGNLWAPDIIYNKAMKKWCLYFSLSGNAFKSTVILLTADRIEGPYAKQGVVVCSGFTNNQNDLGRQEYNKVMGTTNIPARYLRNGQWFNDYGVSCIDPSVMYDENGDLWMNYGSWSGGIFLMKLDNNTGFRDTGHNYGYGNNPGWDGSRLRYDPYLGLHIAGGYYVSGEGPYIEYIKNKNGVGYYYLYVTMGFYSPEGGYTMRVYRSSEIDGIYRDVTGNDAVFDRWIFNYGNNTTFGFPIMQNYKWNWWPEGSAEIATGHNSLLQEEDGSTYLVYHRKMDNGTAWHNVEVHQLFHNEDGWPLAAPFEYREDFGITNTVYDAEDIAGLYGVIDHAPIDYENLASNREQQIYLTADGAIRGAFTGTWTYNYADGQQFITLNTNAGTFRGTVLDLLMNDVSSRTIAFTAMNRNNERALWGYRYTNTKTTNTTVYSGGNIQVGETDYSLVWDDYDDFYHVQTSNDFEVSFTFDNYSEVVENWHNWNIAVENGNQIWYLRSDAYSNSTFSGATVGYNFNWNWETQYKEVFANKEVEVKVAKIGTVINVFAYVGEELVYTASTTNAPAGNYNVYLGGEANYMTVKKVSLSAIGVRQLVGTVGDDGRYTSAFNVAQGQSTTVSGDFELNYTFNNYHNAPSLDNWDNFLLKVQSGGQTSLLRADAFMVDPIGSVTSEVDWVWEDFLEIISGASLEMKITRVNNVVRYNTVITARDGGVYHYNVVNTGAPTGEMTFNFTCEEAMVDLFEVEKVSYTGEDCNGVNGGTAYLDNCDVCVGGTTGLEACEQDCAGEWGGEAYLDNCDICVGGTSGFKSCVGSLEAEEACELDGSVDNNHQGFSGTGFTNTTNAIGSNVNWMFKSDANLAATISFRYANGSTTSRDGIITINGVATGNLVLPPTGSWTTWEIVSLSLNLVQGSNEIDIASTTANGLANIDVIHYSAGVEDAQCIVTHANEALADEFGLYPNPTSSLVHFNNYYAWELFNAKGIVLKSGKARK